MDANDFGERLKALRSEKAKRLGRRNIPQREVATQFNVTPGAYASWETGRTRPDLSLLPEIADYFEVSTDFLLGHSPHDVSITTETGLVWSQRCPAQTENERIGLKAWRLLAQGENLETISSAIGSSCWEKRVECYIEDMLVDMVTIADLPQDRELSERVRRTFDLKEVIVISTLPDTPHILRNIMLGEMGRLYFRENVHPGMEVGLAGGSSVGRMIYALRRGECPAIEVYALASSPMALESPHLDANTLVRTLAYQHRGYGIREYTLPYVSPKDWDKLESWWFVPHTRHILKKAQGVDIVFMGLGALQFRLLEIELLSDIISNEKIKQRGAVGDILYQFVDKDGQPVSPEISDLICAIRLEDLQNLVEKYQKRVVVIASGQEKAEITRVAIKKRYANVLIIDDELAKALVNMLPKIQLSQ